jgi:hypothetical protein
METNNAMSPEEVVELVHWLDLEVDNGGLHQFFNNSAGDKTTDTIAALEAIGAFQTANILQRAAAMFPGGMPPGDRDERVAILWKNFPDPKVFDQLNEEFYAYPDDLLRRLEDFKAKNGLPGDPSWQVWNRQSLL